MTEQQAMQMAIEALELALRCHGVMLLSDPPKDAWKYHSVEANANKAIGALRLALANQALDRKAENARELGLSYEDWGTGPHEVHSIKNQPPQLKPLTKEMIKQMKYLDDYSERGIFVNGWLSAEEAHGIKE